MKTFLVLFVGMVFWSCAAWQREDSNVRIKTMEDRIAVFHRPVTLRIGWQIYTQSEVTRTGDDVWNVVSSDSLKKHLRPLVIVSYGDLKKEIWLEMEMDDATFGRLIKQSLMTQKPIEKPIKEFLQKTDCMTCHPSDIKIR